LNKSDVIIDSQEEMSVVDARSRRPRPYKCERFLEFWVILEKFKIVQAIENNNLAIWLKSAEKLVLGVIVYEIF
jgi:hypothetical protein